MYIFYSKRLVMSKEPEVVESLSKSIAAHLDNPLEVLRVHVFENMDWDVSGKEYCLSLRKRIRESTRSKIDLSTFIPFLESQGYSVKLMWRSGNVVGVFWQTPRQEANYRRFCDVIIVDTTAMKNNYKLPIIDILGINEEFLNVLLGMA
jgi:hypothetical protein